MADQPVAAQLSLAVVWIVDAAVQRPAPAPTDEDVTS